MVVVRFAIFSREDVCRHVRRLENISQAPVCINNTKVDCWSSLQADASRLMAQP